MSDSTPRLSAPRAAVVALAVASVSLAVAGLGSGSTANARARTASKASASLTVGFVVDPSWAQIPVAAAKGYFKAAGLNVKVVDFSTGVQALQAVEAGQVDVTTAADVPVAAALVNSRSIDIIADGSRWKGSVVVASAKAGVKSVATLAGKSIGTALGTSAAYFASSFLKQSRIHAPLVNVDPSEMVTAMQQGNVAAVSIFQPYQQQVITALGKNAVVLSPAKGTYIQQSLYLASRSAIGSKAAALRAFESAIERASVDLEHGNAAAIKAVAAATQLAAPLVKRILRQFDYTVELPNALRQELASLGAWAETVGNLPKTTKLPSYSAFIDRSFLPKS